MGERSAEEAAGEHRVEQRLWHGWWFIKVIEMVVKPRCRSFGSEIVLVEGHMICSNYPIWRLRNYERRSNIPRNTVMMMIYQETLMKKVVDARTVMNGPSS